MAPEQREIPGKSITFETAIEKSAKDRAEYTRSYFNSHKKNLAKFCEDLKKEPFKIEIKPENDQSLAVGIAKLQKLMGFPEADSAKGCDGKYGPFTNKKFAEKMVHEDTHAGLQGLRAALPAAPSKERNTAAPKTAGPTVASAPQPDNQQTVTERPSAPEQPSNLEKVKTSQTVFVGDSLTVGMKRFIGEAKGIYKGGMQTRWMLNNFSKFCQEKAAGQHTETKRVVVLGGINDICSGRSLEHIQGNLSGIKSKAKAVGIEVVLCTIPTWDAQKWRQKRNSPLSVETLEQRTRDLNSWILAQNDCLGVDLHTETANYQRTDAIHFSGAASGRMAQFIMQKANIFN